MIAHIEEQAVEGEMEIKGRTQKKVKECSIEKGTVEERTSKLLSAVVAFRGLGQKSIRLLPAVHLYAGHCAAYPLSLAEARETE